MLVTSTAAWSVLQDDSRCKVTVSDKQTALTGAMLEAPLTRFDDVQQGEIGVPPLQSLELGYHCRKSRWPVVEAVKKRVTSIYIWVEPSYRAHSVSAVYPSLSGDI